MNVSLTPELENLVNEKVASGLYNSASEVVREALRLLFEQEEVRRLRIEELRREIKIGAGQIKQGKYKDYSSANDLINDIRSRGQARLKARRKSKKR
ncbi:MAG TPA: type II toxin-antitoxin system ParD family antitoxin [Blastocatellia bacterium]|nr:type II toxin-antitoxin system ParD family antitoxin [Blastocatellia bacterium]